MVNSVCLCAKLGVLVWSIWYVLMENRVCMYGKLGVCACRVNRVRMYGRSGV